MKSTIIVLNSDPSSSWKWVLEFWNTSFLWAVLKCDFKNLKRTVEGFTECSALESRTHFSFIIFSFDSCVITNGNHTDSISFALQGLHVVGLLAVSTGWGAQGPLLLTAGLFADDRFRDGEVIALSCARADELTRLPWLITMQCLQNCAGWTKLATKQTQSQESGIRTERE